MMCAGMKMCVLEEAAVKVALVPLNCPKDDKQRVRSHGCHRLSRLNCSLYSHLGSVLLMITTFYVIVIFCVTFIVFRKSVFC